MLIVTFLFVSPLLSRNLPTNHDGGALVDGCQFYLVDANSAREKFSSGTEMLVGSLWSLAVYFSWWFILVGWCNLGFVAEL
jgi:hypothetical protein